jgi:hypothetical protein
MNRRHLLLVSLGTVLGGCARFTDDPGSGPVVLPTDPATRVASRIVAGGFVPIGYNEITPPRLAVYADGTAIADAARQLSLTSAETTDLVRGLRRDLSGLPASPKPLGKNAVADAATTTLTVLGADGKTISVSAYALGILHYDAALTAADERIDKLSKRVAEQGKPYVSARIRLVAVPQQGTGTSPRWPDTVPIPSKKDGRMVLVSDLADSVAQAAIAAFPEKFNGPWDTFTTPGGDTLAVSWRYLLPDE